MALFDALSALQYGELHVFRDGPAGLNALVAIHDTTLGPSLGGTRMIRYRREEDAVEDVLRLARGMTYKAALAGLAHGGGKAVVLRPEGSFDRAALFTALGRAVESLGGRYITTEDSGTSPADLDVLRTVTRYALGASRERGGSGDPSPYTAFGVRRAIQAAAEVVLGRKGGSLEGLRVAVQGVGHVGFGLVRELRDAGALVTVSDTDAAAVERARTELGAAVVDPGGIYDVDCDVFAPCALGAILNDVTIPRLRCRAVAGAANNQLATPAHGDALLARGIAYAPDYAANAGGLINVAQEWSGYDEAAARRQCDRIYDTVREILERARAEGTDPARVADRLVEERLARARAR